MKKYFINEMFYSLQGEGIFAGCPAIFIRFAGCNLECRMAEGERSPGGFDCDTDHSEINSYATAQQVVEQARELHGTAMRCILTGGEPMLQLDEALLMELKAAGFAHIAIETNGTVEIPKAMRRYIDWVAMSPKKTETPLKVLNPDEAKYVLAVGQHPHEYPDLRARHEFLMPASDGDKLNEANIAWVVKLILEHPAYGWRMCLQQHKAWGIR